MDSPGDRITNGGDVEALASLAQELANFTIDDLEQVEDELEGDYDSITTDEDGDLYQEGAEEDDCAPGHDFALAVRTSEIISDYRNYLTQVETVSAENRRLANEMDSLRGSLGMEKVPRDPPDRIDLLHDIEIQEEEPPPKRYTHPLLHSSQLKRRLLGAMTTVAVMGSIAVLSSEAMSSKRKERTNIPDWDPELAEALREEEEAYEALREKAALDNAAARVRARESRKPPPKHHDEGDSPAMIIIQEMIAHPKEVQVTSHPRDIPPPQMHDNVSAGGESGKRGELIGIKDSPNSKSSKMFSSESTKSSKSKSGKSSKSENSYLPSYSVSPPVPGDGHEIPDGLDEGLTNDGIETPDKDVQDVEHSMSYSSMSHSMSYPERQGGPENVIDKKSTKSSKSTSKSSKMMGQKRSYIPSTPALALDDGDNEAQLHFEAASILYQAITTKYSPMFFDRSQGWAGKSYSDMVDFCASHYPNDVGSGVPCPYEAYCPEGPNTLPFGGYRTDLTGDGMYAPIIDTAEHWLGWVQLSEGHPCTAYNYLNPSPTEEQTAYTMCCRDARH